MRRFLGSLTAALALVTVAVLGATPAHAATITFDYELDGTESTWQRVGGTAVPCSTQLVGDFYYRTAYLTVDVDGSYTFWDSRISDMGLSDGFIAIYPEFDPASPNSGCLAAFDDNGPTGPGVTLTAGTTYTIVQSTFAPVRTGFFQFSASGLGTVTVSALPADTTTSLTVTPNPAIAGEAVELNALITSPTMDADLSGTVEFFADGISLGVVNVIADSGSAVLPGAQFPEGTHAVTAVYSGNSNTVGSTSAEPVVLVVNPAPVTPIVPTPPQRVETARA